MTLCLVGRSMLKPRREPLNLRGAPLSIESSLTVLVRKRPVGRSSPGPHLAIDDDSRVGYPFTYVKRSSIDENLPPHVPQGRLYWLCVSRLPKSRAVIDRGIEFPVALLCTFCKPFPSQVRVLLHLPVHTACLCGDQWERCFPCSARQRRKACQAISQIGRAHV